MEVRFGVVLVGPTGGGKSECYRTLQGALTHLRERMGSRHAAYQVRAFGRHGGQQPGGSEVSQPFGERKEGKGCQGGGPWRWQGVPLHIL